jgi:hypothetical protein
MAYHCWIYDEAVILDMLYEQTGVQGKVIYFTIYELIRRAGKDPTQDE